jgi:hypothetical protein
MMRCSGYVLLSRPPRPPASGSTPLYRLVVNAFWIVPNRRAERSPR